MSKKLKGLTDSYEENLLLIEELEVLADCHSDEVLVEIIGEALETTRLNALQIIKEMDEERREFSNYN